MSRLKSTQSIDIVYLALIGVLILFGLIMLTSASGPTGYQKPFNDSLYFLKHQVFFGLVPGMVGMFVLSRVPYHFWKKHAWEFLIVSIALLVIVFIPGVGSEFGTSRSWITLWGLFSLQPAEVVKLTFLFYLAAWVEQRGAHGMKDVHAGLIPFVSVLGAVVLLLILQPDVGSMSIIAAISLVVYFVAGAPLLHISGLIAAGFGDTG